MGTIPQTGLEKRRSDIDALDDQLLALLNQRAAIAQEVGDLKQSCPEGAASKRDEAREGAIIERLRSQNAGPLGNEAIEKIFHEIFNACLEVQK